MNGTAGQAGSAGNGFGQLELDAGDWQLTAGQNGGTGFQGRMGAGGGGGGGGGSCSDEDQVKSTYLAGAGAGGGGGGGGCGGLGGIGGGGGGASIALILIDTHVILKEQSRLVTRGGGAGGAGGAGGDGGRGGLGGVGGARAKIDVPAPTDNKDRQYSNYGGAGGSGGRGGTGGPGGVGGGGAVGPSVGIWCAGDAGVSIGEDTIVTLADGGSGGPSEGNPGAEGITEFILNCRTIP